MRRLVVSLLGAFLVSTTLLGCSQSYPADRVKEAIKEICRKEYGIKNIEVKIMGATVGVFLPVEKLFVTDFKEALSKVEEGGKITDLENLFQPAPEALEQVEDVLFSISRVLLSTERKLQFYILQATDIEQTGLQLVLVGYVDDIKRVRLWDISRDEYRRRILHELRMNRAAIWSQPVRAFFKTLETMPSLSVLQEHFAYSLTPEHFESLFLFNPEAAESQPAQWQLGELKSTALGATQVLVQVPVTVTYDPEKMARGSFRVPSGSSLEYLFIVSYASDLPKITRVVPLFFLDESGMPRKIQIPEAMDLSQDLLNWEFEFPLQEIVLGDFLAQQLTRRTQQLLFADERIRNTFESIHLAFRYEAKPEEKNYFSLDLEMRLRGRTPLAPEPTALQEDVRHLLTLASREFVNVLRSYQFSDYEFLQLNLSSDPVARILGREDLELFRRNKIDFQGLLLRGMAAV